MTYELQSVERALEIIAFFMRVEKANLTDICQQLGANQTTIFRTIRVLENHGYLRRLSEGGRDYALGTHLIEIGAAAAKRIDITAIMRPVMLELSRKFGVSANLGMLREGQVTVIDTVDPPTPMIMLSMLGLRMPLHATASGKAILALKRWNKIEDAGFPLPLTRLTPKTIVDMEQLRAETDANHARGYSLDVEEYHLGYCTVAVALPFKGGVFSIGLSSGIVAEDELHRRGEALLHEVERFSIAPIGEKTHRQDTGATDRMAASVPTGASRRIKALDPATE